MKFEDLFLMFCMDEGSTGGAPPDATRDMLVQLQKAAKDLRDIADAGDTERKKFGDTLAETKSALDKVNARIDSLEVKLEKPPSSPQAPESLTEKQAVESLAKFMRHDRAALTTEEIKSFTTNDGPHGGFLLPAPTKGTIIELASSFSPVRSLASFESIAGNEWEAPRENALLTVSDVNETGTRSNTGTVSDADWFVMERIVTHEMYAQPPISQTLLEDNSYNLESFLTSRLSKAFGLKEADWFINGNGISQAEGMLTNSSLTIDKNGHATVIDPSRLITMTYALHEQYEKNASFLMRRATVGVIRALKDAVTGTYLWQPAFSAGAPATILGFAVHHCADMPAVGSGAVPILFGDFREGYKIIDKRNMVMLRDPYSSKPYIIFYTTRRVGGKVVNPAAIRKFHMVTD